MGDTRPHLQPVRPARPHELAALAALEAAADARFAPLGMGPFEPVSTPSQLATMAAVLVAGDPPVGFATVGAVDGLAHLWQLSVHPAAGRRGVGSALVEGACAWARAQGYAAITLTTFRDVAWNGPFYRRLGFRDLAELTPGLQQLRDHERDQGDDDFGPRVAMRRDLAP